MTTQHAKSNANEPAWRPEEVMTLDAHGAVSEIRQAGLTKREAFAMAAMQGFLANDNNGSETESEIAEWSVKTADALLAELAKEPK